MQLAVPFLLFIASFTTWMNCCNAQSSVDYYTCHSGSNYFANATNCADKNPTLCLSLFPRGAPSTLAPLGMRNFKCRDPALYDMALECASTCYACCLRSTYTCGDSPVSPINCYANVRLCKDANWTTVMNTYCPGTCGTCLSASCRDINVGCRDYIQLCNDMTFRTYMNERCARTCNVCPSAVATTATTPSSSCFDTATNCALNIALCTNSAYATLMTQKCAKTCGRCSSSSTACTDTAINCASNRAVCNNAAYYTLMTQKCAKTCGRCSSTNLISSNTCVDTNSNCPAWIRNGFCGNSFYTVAQKRQYCARSCNLC